ncbi:MAG: mechanosensitive ion channel family protein [Candidatus Binatia bacterium]|nr:mechanosensitive ion channel family protein [Candidatus Binatia bacterium]
MKQRWFTTRGWLVACALLATIGGRPQSVLAQVTETPLGMAPPPTPTSAGPVDDYGRGTPRSTVRGFLEACGARDYARAAQFLDLRRIRTAEREEVGPQLARQLCVVIDRTVWLDPEQVSDSPEGDRDDGLPARRESIAVIPSAEKPTRVYLERGPREDGALIWRVAPDTVARIPALYQEFGYGPLETYLPKPFFELQFLGVRLWQWIGFAILAVVAWLLAWVLTRISVRVGRAIVSQSWVPLSEDAVIVMRAPLHGLFTFAIFRSELPLLALSVRAAHAVQSLTSAGMILLTAWLLMRSVDVAARAIEERAANRQAVVSLLPLGRRATKVFLAILTLLVALQNLGFNVTSVLAGLGIGGLAVALAGQKTLEHFFGGITLVADQPVRVGEFCRFGDKLGVVEDIGLRSTRIRTLDRTVLSVPNGEFASMQIENFSRRDRIRLTANLGLRYETTPDQLRYVLVEIKKLLIAHPKVSPDPARVRFVGFGPYSLDLEILAYIETTEHDEFLAVREDLFLRIMDIVAESGTSFAFPSQTVYCGQDSGLDAARRAQAEAQVRAWREEHRLWLPYPPEEEVAALRGTLAYPPPGSALS